MMEGFFFHCCLGLAMPTYSSESSLQARQRVRKLIGLQPTLQPQSEPSLQRISNTPAPPRSGQILVGLSRLSGSRPPGCRPIYQPLSTDSPQVRTETYGVLQAIQVTGSHHRVSKVGTEATPATHQGCARR